MLGALIAWLMRLFFPAGMAYTEARAQIQTFDLVYFCELASWTGCPIAVFGGKIVTHMGLAVRVHDEIYLLESVNHAGNSLDVLSAGGGVHTGVRLVSLHHELTNAAHNYYVWVQPIEMTTENRRSAEQALWPLMKQLDGVAFERHRFAAFRSMCDAPPGVGALTDTSSFYCSELVAHVLRQCGLLRVSNVSNITPAHFLAGGMTLSNAVLTTAGFYLKIERLCDHVVVDASRVSAAVAAASPVIPHEHRDAVRAQVAAIISGNTLNL